MKGACHDCPQASRWRLPPQMANMVSFGRFSGFRQLIRLWFTSNGIIRMLRRNRNLLNASALDSPSGSDSPLFMIE